MHASGIKVCTSGHYDSYAREVDPFLSGTALLFSALESNICEQPSPKTRDILGIAWERPRVDCELFTNSHCNRLALLHDCVRRLLKETLGPELELRCVVFLL